MNERKYDLSLYVVTSDRDAGSESHIFKAERLDVSQAIRYCGDVIRTLERLHPEPATVWHGGQRELPFEW